MPMNPSFPVTPITPGNTDENTNFTGIPSADWRMKRFIDLLNKLRPAHLFDELSDIPVDLKEFQSFKSEGGSTK